MSDGQTGKKTTEPKPVEPKNIRLDRMEENIQLIEKGVLILINAMWWLNATITPVGTHNPDVKMEEFETLEDAIEEDEKDKD